jgi:hypothetical protein
MQFTLRKLVNSPSFSLFFCEKFTTKIWWVDEMFHNVLVDERKNHITLLLHGRKSITILCPDDVCKKIRKEQGERVRGYAWREMRGGLITRLQNSSHKVMD